MQIITKMYDLCQYSTKGLAAILKSLKTDNIYGITF